MVLFFTPPLGTIYTNMKRAGSGHRKMAELSAGQYDQTRPISEKEQPVLA